MTLPRPWAPPYGVSSAALFGAENAHGDGKLWVGGLWPGGVIDAGPGFVNRDGSVGMKFGWWRNVHGQLHITGRRLDHSSAPLLAEIPAGYGPYGFQATGVIFPTQGCWQVTGRVGRERLTFVTLVVKRVPAPRGRTGKLARRAAVRVLPCSEAIGTAPPAREMSVVAGVVGLPTSRHMSRALQTAPSGPRRSAGHLFAKEGLVIRAGAHFKLVVPERLRGRLSIGWGNAGEGHVGSTISVPGCPGHGRRWLDFAGGYWVHRTMCAQLIVDADGRRRRVSIGLGRPCPGQRPPPQPTYS